MLKGANVPVFVSKMGRRCKGEEFWEGTGSIDWDRGKKRGVCCISQFESGAFGATRERSGWIRGRDMGKIKR